MTSRQANERRRLIAELLRQGFGDEQIIGYLVDYGVPQAEAEELVLDFNDNDFRVEELNF